MTGGVFLLRAGGWWRTPSPPCEALMGGDAPVWGEPSANRSRCRIAPRHAFSLRRRSRPRLTGAAVEREKSEKKFGDPRVHRFDLSLYVV